MNIGIDIDDVIADFITTLALFHNHFYGGQLTKEDFVSYDFWNVWGGSREEAIRKVDEMFSFPEYYKNITPIEQSFDSLTALNAKGFNLYAITGRRDHMIPQTTEWLKRYFPGIFLDIFFTNSYSLNEKDQKKSEICNRLKVSVIIEDHIKHALDCAENGIRVLLFDSPWNRSLSDQIANIQRVSSWNNILSIF